jgi:hypothetical protein
MIQNSKNIQIWMNHRHTVNMVSNLTPKTLFSQMQEGGLVQEEGMKDTKNTTTIDRTTNEN